MAVVTLFLIPPFAQYVIGHSTFFFSPPRLSPLDQYNQLHLFLVRQPLRAKKQTPPPTQMEKSRREWDKVDKAHRVLRWRLQKTTYHVALTPDWV